MSLFIYVCRISVGVCMLECVDGHQNRLSPSTKWVLQPSKQQVLYPLSRPASPQHNFKNEGKRFERKPDSTLPLSHTPTFDALRHSLMA